MRTRSLRRAAAAALTSLIIGVVPAFADTIPADGDLVTPGNQGRVSLGTVAPGATLHVDVGMSLVCGYVYHADPGQSITVSLANLTLPAAGGSLEATDATIGPVPATWPDDSAGPVDCPSDLALPATEPSHVTIVAPSTPGTGYEYDLLFGRTLSPAGAFDSTSLRGTTAVSFTLDVAEPIVADTTPPTLVGMPANVDLVTTDPTGLDVAYTPPTATDDRDPNPVVACVPASGFRAAVGTTSVTCTATDASGNAASASFDVVVHLATVRWEEPVGSDAVVMVRSGRTLPVKATAELDGAPVSGSAHLVVSACPGATLAKVDTRTVAARWQADAARWDGLLDTKGLAAGCHDVALIVDAVDYGSFTLLVDPGFAAAPAHR